MLKEKYAKLLALGEELQVADGHVEEAEGKLRIGGTTRYQYDKDRLWDEIKTYAGWEGEIEADIKVADTDIYGVYTVVSGDTLGKLSKGMLGSSRRYMEIFELNRDQLSNPDLIKVGQELKIPNP